MKLEEKKIKAYLSYGYGFDQCRPDLVTPICVPVLPPMGTRLFLTDAKLKEAAERINKHQNLDVSWESLTEQDYVCGITIDYDRPDNAGNPRIIIHMNTHEFLQWLWFDIGEDR